MSQVGTDWLKLIFVIFSIALIARLAAIPLRKRKNKILRDWATSQGLEITDVEWGPFPDFYRFPSSDPTNSRCRVWLRDEQGEQIQCLAQVDPIFRRIQVKPFERG
jgi:hypothetical protein